MRWPPGEAAAPARALAAQAIATPSRADTAQAAAGLEPPAEPLPGGADLALAPPPLVRVQLPPPGRWHYLGQQTGPGLVRPVRAEWQWQWQPAEGRYDLAFTLWAVGSVAPAPVAATTAPVAPVTFTGATAATVPIPTPAAPSAAGVVADPRPLWAQTSRGRLQPWGLAPERLEDRRRGRGARAASMVWPGDGGEANRQSRPVPAGRLSFSASTRVGPAWPGLQDRLSWLPQLSGAVAAAAAGTGTGAGAGAGAGATAGPAPLRLLVADASGQVLDWRFEPVPPEASEGEAPGPAAAAAGLRTGTGTGAGMGADAGAPALQRWRHTPPTDDGLQVDVWLDPSLGHWPRRLRYRWPRTGHQLDLRLAAPQDLQNGPPRDPAGHGLAGPPPARAPVPPPTRPPEPPSADASSARPQR